MTLIPLRPAKEWDPFEEMSNRYPHDDEDSIVVKAELRGLKKDAVSINIGGNVLTFTVVPP